VIGVRMTTESTCRYCGSTFTVRREPLGRSLCQLCVNLLRERYAHSQSTQLATDFHIGTDSLETWARRHRLERQVSCVSCGRTFSKPNSSGQCPICLLNRVKGTG